MTIFVSKKTIITDEGTKAKKTQIIENSVSFLFIGIELLLIFRFVFKFIGANPASGFGSLIYSLTQPLILPFAGIFRQTTTTGMEITGILEPATLVAIVVYAILAWALTRIMIMLADKLH